MRFWFITQDFLQPVSEFYRTCALAIGSDLLAINLCANKGTLPGDELTSDPFIRGSGRSSVIVLRHTRRPSDSELTFTLSHFLTKEY